VAGDAASADMLNGTWRLVYSSAFARGGLGGSRPGPPAALLPVKLGQVCARCACSLSGHEALPHTRCMHAAQLQGLGPYVWAHASSQAPNACRAVLMRCQSACSASACGAQVYQTIALGRLDNVVELYGRFNLPALPGVVVDPIITTATLKHALRVTGVRRVEIAFEDTELKTTGGRTRPRPRLLTF